MPDTPLADLDWDHLRFFLAAAETGSLSAAARRLRSNQPTVGRHIDALESRLGLRLFQRNKRGLVLTQDGALVLEQARHVQTGVAGIKRLAGGGAHTSGSVRLAIPEGLCNEVLVPALDSFYRRHPGIKLVLDVSSRAADLVRGDADIAIRLFRPREADLVARRIASMEMGLFASRSYVKKHGRPRAESGLREHRIIAYGEALAGLAENGWLLAHGLSQNVVFSSDSTSARLRATEEGLGISVQPCMLALAGRNLVRLLPDRQLPEHEIWITYHKDLRRVSRARAVVDFVTTLLAQAAAPRGKITT